MFEQQSPAAHCAFDSHTSSADWHVSVVASLVHCGDPASGVQHVDPVEHVPLPQLTPVREVKSTGAQPASEEVDASLGSLCVSSASD